MSLAHFSFHYWYSIDNSFHWIKQKHCNQIYFRRSRTANRSFLPISRPLHRVTLRLLHGFAFWLHLDWQIWLFLVWYSSSSVLSRDEIAASLSLNSPLRSLRYFHDESVMTGPKFQFAITKKEFRIFSEKYQIFMYLLFLRILHRMYSIAFRFSLLISWKWRRYLIIIRRPTIWSVQWLMILMWASF